MSLATIASALAYFEVDREEFFSKSRFTRPVTARQAVSYVMKTRDGTSYSSIGLRLKRDHSTIIHAVEKVEETLAKDDELRIWVEAQMAIPKHPLHPTFIDNPYRMNMSVSGRKPAPNEKPPVLIDLPNFRPVPKPPEKAEPNRFHIDESAEVGGKVLHMNKDGNCLVDHLDLVRIERGSQKLMKAILREHPERRRA